MRDISWYTEIRFEPFYDLPTRAYCRPVAPSRDAVCPRCSPAKYAAGHGAKHRKEG